MINNNINEDIDCIRNATTFNAYKRAIQDQFSTEETYDTLKHMANMVLENLPQQQTTAWKDVSDSINETIKQAIAEGLVGTDENLRPHLEANLRRHYKALLTTPFANTFQQAVLSDFAQDAYGIALHNGMGENMAANLRNNIAVNLSLNNQSLSKSTKNVSETLEKFFNDSSHFNEHSKEISKEILNDFKTRFEPQIEMEMAY